MTIIKYLLHNIKPNTPKVYEGVGYKANVQIIPKIPWRIIIFDFITNRKRSIELSLEKMHIPLFEEDNC